LTTYRGKDGLHLLKELPATFPGRLPPCLVDLLGQSTSPDDELILGIKAIGHHWFSCIILRDKEYQVKVFNPLKVNWFRGFYIQPVKIDVKDAF